METKFVSEKSVIAMADGAETLIETTMIQATIPVLIAAKSTDPIKYIDGSIDVIKGGLKIGTIAFPEFAPLLFSLSGVGTTIQAGLKFLSGQPDPVQEKLKELTEKIVELEDKMQAGFNDIKNFITENLFNIKIVSEIHTLKEFMRNCMISDKSSQIDVFRNEYEKNTPLNMAYILQSLLDQSSCNPLKMALAKEDIKLTATFNKWQDNILGIMVDLLQLEAFACGLFKNGNQYDWDRLIDVYSEIMEDLKQWKESYKNDDYYWNEIKQWLVPYVKSHQNRSNTQKANEIQSKIAEYFPKDALCNDGIYVIVFDEHKNTQFAYHCPDKKSKMIYSWKNGLCNVIIYRSLTANDLKWDEYKKTREDVEACMSKLDYLSGTLQNVLDWQLVHQKSVRSDGFVFLADNGCYAEIRSVNFSWTEKGPGWYEFVRVYAGYYDIKPLIVGYP